MKIGFRGLLFRANFRPSFVYYNVTFIFVFSVTYKISGNLSMLCVADAYPDCEYYGKLNFQIGNRPENQNMVAWSKKGFERVSHTINVVYTVTFSLLFDEYESFATNGDKNVLLDGQIKEFDPNGFQIIANLNGELYTVTNVFGKYQTKKVSNASNDFAEVTLTITRA